MKKLLLLSAALLGMTAVSHAGGVHVGINIGLPPLPRAVIVNRPAPPPVCYAPPPVYYAPPPPVYHVPPPVVYYPPPRVVYAPPIVCTPACHPRLHHRDCGSHRYERHPRRDHHAPGHGHYGYYRR